MTSGVFDLHAIMARFPAQADTMLVDTRISDEAAASARVFRLYKEVPPHYHVTCDEYLFVLAGRGTFSLGTDAPFPIQPGQLVVFARGTVHSITVTEGPLVFYAVDTPRRPPTDVVFVNPDDGTPQTFIKTEQLS
jgi:mannose-6-phosphate isomerase-like protein (cupin superfamily)